MLAFRFQKDRKNAPKAFSVYNLDFQNGTYFPSALPSGRKYAILTTPSLTFWYSDTLLITTPHQAVLANQLTVVQEIRILQYWYIARA